MRFWGRCIRREPPSSAYQQLGPGEIVEIEGVETTRRVGTVYSLDGANAPRPDAAAALGEALRAAIDETWTDPEARLLLSGGLNSRLLLGLAKGERKAMTLDWHPEETPIARRVAAACSAEFKLLPFQADAYSTKMQYGYLVTGGAHNSRLVNNLGMATEWRRSGIPAIVHGYFHNTIFRGWTAGRRLQNPDLGTPLAKYMGAKAHYFDCYSHFPLRVRAEVIRLLSPEGRRLLEQQLRDLAHRIEPVIVDGFDLTFERLVMSQVARQIYFGIFLGWLEEIDVESPVFHEASWRWYASTHPADRYRDRAVYKLYQLIGHGLAEIPDFSTGKALRPETAELREIWKSFIELPGIRAAAWVGRRVKRFTFPLESHDWDQVYRQQPIIDALQTGIEPLKDNPLFDGNAIRGALDRWLKGQSKSTDTLWALTKAGQWQNFVSSLPDDRFAIRTIPDAENELLGPMVRTSQV